MSAGPALFCKRNRGLSRGAFLPKCNDSDRSRYGRLCGDGGRVGRRIQSLLAANPDLAQLPGVSEVAIEVAWARYTGKLADEQEASYPHIWEIASGQPSSGQAAGNTSRSIGGSRPVVSPVSVTLTGPPLCGSRNWSEKTPVNSKKPTTRWRNRCAT